MKTSHLPETEKVSSSFNERTDSYLKNVQETKKALEKAQKQIEFDLDRILAMEKALIEIRKDSQIPAINKGFGDVSDRDFQKDLDDNLNGGRKVDAA